MGAGYSLQPKVKPLIFKLLAFVFERFNNVLKSRRFFSSTVILFNFLNPISSPRLPPLSSILFSSIFLLYRADYFEAAYAPGLQEAVQNSCCEEIQTKSHFKLCMQNRPVLLKVTNLGLDSI